MAKKNIDKLSDTTKPLKRLGILFFYDSDGVVDRYVDYLISGMMQVLSELIVVVNGTLTPDGRDVFTKYARDVIVRKNEGLDVWAYKTALEFVGWEKLEGYDEVVLFNHTIMGPVYPISEMFDRMAENPKLDFWGATKHLGMPNDPFGFCKYGYIPEHIQSSFIVYRKKFIRTRELKEFWRDMPEIHGYNESVAFYESIFTKHFADMGFRWDCYVDNSDDSELTNYLLIADPRKALEKYRSPFFKRRSFFQDGDYYYAFTGGETASELFRFLKEKTNYDVGLILENLIRTVHQADLVRTLNLNYVIPSETELSEIAETESCALLVYLSNEKELQKTLHYASAMPDWGDIYIEVTSKELKQKAKEIFGCLPNYVSIRIAHPQNENNLHPFWDFGDVIDKYSYICFYHDDCEQRYDPSSINESYSYLLFESVLHSKKYVKNILDTFKENPYLGMLSPVPACHSYFYPGYCQDWDDEDYSAVEQLKKDLKLETPMAKNMMPVAPDGMVFWFRSDALRKMLRENKKVESTLRKKASQIRIIARILAYAVQDAGFYPGYIMPEYIASVRMNMMAYYVRTYGKIITARGLDGFGMQISAREQLEKGLSQNGVVNTPVVNAPSESRLSQCTTLDKPIFGCKEALAIAIHNRIPFLFKKVAQRFPPSARALGFKEAFAIWRIKRIARRVGVDRLREIGI